MLLIQYKDTKYIAPGVFSDSQLLWWRISEQLSVSGGVSLADTLLMLLAGVRCLTDLCTAS